MNKYKKIPLISFILVLSILFLTRCDLKREQRLFSNDIDTLLAEKLDSANRVLQNQYAREIEEMKHVYQEKIDSLSKECENEVTGKYHVIVGAFKTPSYARQYADKIASLGYSTQIIDYRNEFQLVSAGSAMNLKNAKAQLELLRDNVSVNAWIHVN